jgi:hypothetical protein
MLLTMDYHLARYATALRLYHAHMCNTIYRLVASLRASLYSRVGVGVDTFWCKIDFITPTCM